MSGHREAMRLAAAALQDLISQGAALQASAIRGDGARAGEGIRAKAHAVLDAYLDHMSSAGVNTRNILEP